MVMFDTSSANPWDLESITTIPSLQPLLLSIRPELRPTDGPMEPKLLINTGFAFSSRLMRAGRQHPTVEVHN